MTVQNYDFYAKQPRIFQQKVRLFEYFYYFCTQKVTN